MMKNLYVCICVKRVDHKDVRECVLSFCFDRSLYVSVTTVV